MSPPPTLPEGPPGPSKKSPLFYFLLALASAVVAAMFLPLASGKVYVLDDLGSYGVPMRYFEQKALARGESPIWTDALSGGLYVHGEASLCLYNPLVYVAYRYFPLEFAFMAELILRYPVAILGLYLLARRWGLAAESSLFAGVTFAFGGFCLMRFIHPSVVQTAACIPYMLLLTDILLRGESEASRRWAWVGLVAAGVTQVMANFAQLAYYSAQAELLYIVIISLYYGTRIARISAWAAARALAVLIYAVQIVPMLDAHANSYRKAASLDYLLACSLHPKDLLQLFSPYWFRDRCHDGEFPWEDSLYCGAATTVLAIWALLRWKQLRRFRIPLVFAASLSAIGLLFSLGKYGLIFLPQTYLPVVGGFRVPGRYIVLVHIGMSLLAAMALDDVIASRNRGENPVPKGLRYLVGFLLLLLGYSAVRGLSDPGPFPGEAAGTILLLVATGLVYLASRGGRAATYLLLLFAVTDQVFYSYSFYAAPRRRTPHSSHPIMTIEEYKKQFNYPAGIRPGRDKVAFVGFDNHFLLRDLDSATGYLVLRPDRRLDYTDPKTLRLSGVRWVAEYAEPDSPEKGLTWEEIPDPLPYARMVHRASVSRDPRRSVAALDIENEAVTERPIALDARSGGSVTVVRREPGRIALETRSEGDSLVVLQESYHQGWRLEAEGGTTSSERVNGDFLGFVAGAGRREYQLVFQPRSLLVGKVISVLSLCLFLAVSSAILVSPTRKSWPFHVI